MGAFAWITVDWEPGGAASPLGAGPGGSFSSVGFDFLFASAGVYCTGHGDPGWSYGHRGI